VNCLPWLASNHDPPDLCLVSSQDYRREPLVQLNMTFRSDLKWGLVRLSPQRCRKRHPGILGASEMASVCQCVSCNCESLESHLSALKYLPMIHSFCLTSFFPSVPPTEKRVFKCETS
jgi:hypothetical protein